MRLTLKIIGPLAFLAALAYFVIHLDLNKVNKVSSSIHWEYFFVAIFINSIAFFNHAIRWKLFFKEPKVDLGNVFRSVSIGHMFNSIFPGQTGEFVRPYFIKRISNLPYLDVLATCFVEKFFDTAILLICLLIGVYSFGYNPVGASPLMAMIGLYSAAAFLLATIYFYPLRALEGPIKKQAANIRGGIQRIRSFKNFKKIVFYTISYWTLKASAVWMVLNGLELSSELKSFPAALLATAALAAARALPIAPATSGVYYYTVYELLSVITENTEGTLGNANLFFAAGLLIYLAGAAPALIIGGLSYLSFPSGKTAKKTRS